MRFFASIAAACLLLSGCTTAATSLAPQASVKPAPGARVLMVEPDVQLALLNAAGLQEPRADWSETSRDNITAEVEKALKARGHAAKPLQPDEAMSGRVGQLLRLNQAVVTSVQTSALFPTKKGPFDWTLGEGAQTIGTTYEGDYALFISCRGSWSTGGRYLAFLAVAAAGVAIPMGGQAATASLVDLKTGRIVWFNTTVAGAGDDMRTPEGAATVVNVLLKNLPL